MVKLTRIYTRGGDKGKTALGGGQRVVKHHPRVAAYGSVDEANAAVGLARLHTAELKDPEIDAMLDLSIRRQRQMCIRDRNRLSDLFFVMSRFVNDKGAGDVLWEPGATRNAAGGGAADSAKKVAKGSAKKGAKRQKP